MTRPITKVIISSPSMVTARDSSRRAVLNAPEREESQALLPRAVDPLRLIWRVAFRSYYLVTVQ